MPQARGGRLDSQALAKQEQRRDTAKTAATAAENAEHASRAAYTEIVRLGKAIPADVDMPSVLVQLDAAAHGTGIRFTKITMGERVVTPAATTAPPAAGSESGASAAPVAADGATAQSGPGTAVESANDTAQTADQGAAAAEQSGVDPADTQTSTTPGAADAAAGTATAAHPPGSETVPLELEFVGDFYNLCRLLPQRQALRPRGQQEHPS